MTLVVHPWEPGEVFPETRIPPAPLAVPLVGRKMSFLDEDEETSSVMVPTTGGHYYEGLGNKEDDETAADDGAGNKNATTTKPHHQAQEQQRARANSDGSENKVVGEPFPLKLHKLLEQMEQEGRDDILGWRPDGRSFAIYKPKEFIEQIMSEHFPRQSKYKSFQVRNHKSSSSFY